MTSYLEQRIQEAERDGPVHEYKSGDNLMPETAELPIESTFIEVRGGKYYRMWHTEDLDERLIHVNLMATTIKQTFSLDRKDLRNARPGSKIFSFDKPVARPIELINKCRLHPQDPERPSWDLMGLPTCSKPLANPYEVDRHMQKKHATAWGAIERDRLSKERLEDRKAQQAMMEAIGRSLSPTEALDAIADPSIPAKVVQNMMELRDERKERTRVDVSCNQCSFRTWSTTQTKAANKLKKHVKDQHA